MNSKVFVSFSYVYEGFSGFGNVVIDYKQNISNLSDIDRLKQIIKFEIKMNGNSIENIVVLNFRRMEGFC